MPDRDNLVNMKQAAERLGCSEAAIRKWVRQGRLRVVRLGRLCRFRTLDLDAVVTKGLPTLGSGP
jgi:excisionase family DNA binding protein